MPRTASPITLALLASLALASSAAAQEPARAGAPPDAQAGVGLHTRGMSLQYAAAPWIHAGVHLTVNATSSEGASVLSLGVRPYARALLAGLVTPFAEAGVDVGVATSHETPLSSHQQTTSLVLMVGLEHFVERTLGLYVAVELLNAQVDPSPSWLSLGVFNPRAGIEWFFGG